MALNEGNGKLFASIPGAHPRAPDGNGTMARGLIRDQPGELAIVSLAHSFQPNFLSHVSRGPAVRSTTECLYMEAQFAGFLSGSTPVDDMAARGGLP